MISVCIATYNGALYIKEQLDSILTQLGEEDEVIISDDASSDETLAEVESFNDKRIRVLHHTPYAQSRFSVDKTTHNFENALREAKGDYIFLSDQDDIWLPNKVSVTLDALQTADLVVHDCQMVSTKRQPILPSYFKYIRVHTGALQNAIRCTYLGCCMAFRKEVLSLALPFPATCVAHDQWIGIIAAIKFKTILIHQPLILYRRHSKTQTQCGGKSSLPWWYKIYYKLIVVYHTIQALLTL